jgi:hypothetical protein
MRGRGVTSWNIDVGYRLAQLQKQIEKMEKVTNFTRKLNFIIRNLRNLAFMFAGVGRCHPFNEGSPDLYPRHVRMCS